MHPAEYQKKWRAAAIAALGGKCSRCGFSDSRALQIDHVHGGGRKERFKKVNNETGQTYYRMNPARYHKQVIEQADTGKYQLLCANCNWIKRVVSGEEN